MSLLSVFRWLADSQLSTAIANSHYAFAVIEMVHLMGLTLLGGAVIVTDLTALGLISLKQEIGEIQRDLSPVAAVGLAMLLISGFFMLADGPLRYYGNAAFRLKMLLLVVAALFYFSVHRRALSVAPGARPRGKIRLAALTSLTLWFGVALAGRAIGVL